MIKRVAVGLAKSGCQVTESACVGQLGQRKRLGIRQYMQEHARPVYRVLEAPSTAHCW